jgi:hypothetical protein
MDRDFQNLFGLKHNILHIPVFKFNTGKDVKLIDFFILPVSVTGKTPKVTPGTPI